MNKEEILKKLAAGELEVEAASKMLAELDQPKRGSLYCKVSEKGAVTRPSFTRTTRRCWPLAGAS